MKRRGFLGLLAGGTALIAVPELLLPRDPHRTIFLPPRRAMSSMLVPLPYKEPNSVVFDLLQYMERYSHGCYADQRLMLMSSPREAMMTYMPAHRFGEA